MKTSSGSLREMFSSLHRNKGLIKALAKRDIQSRYRGSMLGLLWAIINPLILLGIYTFVFSEIFKSNWPSSGGGKAEAALFIFIGLIIFSIFSECINLSPKIILNNTNYVKKVVFPLEILPIVAIAPPLFQAVINFAVWVVVYALEFGSPKVTILYLPLIIIPLIFILAGISWFIAALGVYLRDISQLTGLMVAALMFLSPIFYSIDHFPEAYRNWLFINPLTLIIEQVRGILILGVRPDLQVLSVQAMVSILVAWGGFRWFQISRRGFADVV